MSDLSNEPAQSWEQLQQLLGGRFAAEREAFDTVLGGGESSSDAVLAA
ncbi:hypothetical protein [Mycolicibacterium sp.]